MPPTVQVGAILIEGWPAMTNLFGIDSEPYSGSWSVVKAVNGFALDRKIHAAGWNFFSWRGKLTQYSGEPGEQTGFTTL